MYNRYIPEDASYSRVEERPIGQNNTSAPEERPRQTFHFPDFLSGKESLSGLLGNRKESGLSGLLSSLHLDRIDSGDVLLLLIILYLLVEGDDLELVIALGLVLLMGLGEEDT